MHVLNFMIIGKLNQLRCCLILFYVWQLLDVCRRLDAAELSGHKDPIEEAEFETLRVLLNVS